MVQTSRPKLAVLQSFPVPRPTTNPYIVMLHDALANFPEMKVLTFTWRRALFGHYHVFHAHWPEILASGRSPLKKLVRQGLMALFLLRLQLSRIPVVRTQHNLHRPSGISVREHLLLSWFESITRYSILLNPDTPVPVGTGSTVIPHGHYRDWYSPHRHSAPITGRFSYFGLIRHYKNVDRLIEAFRTLPNPDLSLHIAGNPSTDDLGADLRARAAGDPRITLDLRFLPDADLVTAATQGEVIVLPYREMHNSGGVLAALSLDRPVLVPNNEVNRDLAAEVGNAWVISYDGDLSSADLLAALDAAQRVDTGSPDLSGRDWDDCGRLHAAAYREAIRMGGRSG